MQFEVLKDFREEKVISKETKERYLGKISEEMMGFWENYGLGNFCNGFFKSVNPDEYKELFETTSLRYTENGVVVFATGLADLIIENNKRLYFLQYRKGIISLLSVKMKFFLQALSEENSVFLSDYLNSDQYFLALEKYGAVQYEEAFGYVPLLGLGGSEKIENLDKVKIKEHIFLISQLVGPVDL